MSRIRALVRQAKLRLALATFGRSFAYTLSAASILSMLVILTKRQMVFPFAVDTILLINFTLAVISSLAFTWLKLPEEVGVAQEVDKRCNLKERLSTSLSLEGDLAESEIARALIADTEKSTGQINLTREFPLKPTRLFCLPCLLVPCMFLLYLWMDPVGIAKAEPVSESKVEEKNQVNEAAKLLKRQIQQRKRNASEKGLLEAEKLYGRLESKIDSVIKDPKMDQKQTMIAMNDLKKQLEQRSSQLSNPESFKKILAQMKGLQAGVGKEMLDAMKKGDYKSAKERIDQLANQLQKEGLSEQEKASLKKELDALGNALKKSIDAATQQKNQLERQLESAREAGDQAEVARLQEQLQSLDAQERQMQSLREMSDLMESASKSLDNDQLMDASASMEELAQRLDEMQKEASELKDLESTLGDIAQSKSAMRCQACSGSGCSQCSGSSMSSGQMASRQANGSGTARGDGLGKGSGFGDRPETESETNTYQTQVQGKLTEGKSVIAGIADGPNRKGVSREDLKQAIKASLKEQGSPSENQVIPRAEREHARQYFDQLREGS